MEKGSEGRTPKKLTMTWLLGGGAEIYLQMGTEKNERRGRGRKRRRYINHTERKYRSEGLQNHPMLIFGIK